MNSMQIANYQKPTTIGATTIGELRDLLNNLEESWTDMEVQHIGELNDQTLHISLNERGIAPAVFKYCAEFGLVAFSQEF